MTACVDTVIGTGEEADGGDQLGPRDTALNRPHGVSVDGFGTTYIADTGNGRVRRLRPNGDLVTLLGGAGFRLFGGRPRLSSPNAVSVGPGGDLFVADTEGHRVLKLAFDGKVTPWVGTGKATALRASMEMGGAMATETSILFPAALAFDSRGLLHVAEGNRIRRRDPDGRMRTVAGTGEFGFSGDGGHPGQAELRSPKAIAFDAAGNLYIADTGNHRIRRVPREGPIETVAGIAPPRPGVPPTLDPLPALRAVLESPCGLAFDSEGSLFISSGNAIRKLEPDGTLTLIAGGYKPGFAGDGGDPLDALFRSPAGLSLDVDGSLYIADRGNHRIRRISGIARPIRARQRGPLG